MSSSPLDPTKIEEANDREGPYRKSIMQVDDLIESGFSLSGNERNCAFLNRAGARFASVGAVTGLDFKDDARGLATVDWDGDGDLDVWTANRTAPMLRFARNDSPATRGWLQVRLRGTSCNRDAIGAAGKITLEGGGNLMRVLKAGEGFLSQSSKWLHFGLGAEARVQKVSVRWPGGLAESFDGATAGAHWSLVQGTGNAVAVRERKGVALSSEPLQLPDQTGGVHALFGSRPVLPRLPYSDLDGGERFAGGKSETHTLVNLWATWCVPCIAELKEFTARAADFEAAGVRVLPLAVDGLVEGGEDGAGDPAAYLKKLGVPFLIGRATAELMDRVNLIRSRSWGVRWDLPVPTSLLLDKDGRVLAFYTGPVSADRVLADSSKAALDPIAFHDAALPFAGEWLERPKRFTPLPFALDLMSGGHLADAREFVDRAQPELSASPEFGKLMTWIGGQLMERGETADALVAFEAGLEADPKNMLVLNNLAWQLAANSDASVRDGARAVKWAEKAAEFSEHSDPAVLDTLAAAYAQNGEMEKAVATGEKALALARKQGNRPLSEAIGKGLEFYRSGRAYGR